MFNVLIFGMFLLNITTQARVLFLRKLRNELTLSSYLWAEPYTLGHGLTTAMHLRECSLIIKPKNYTNISVPGLL